MKEFRAQSGNAVVGEVTVDMVISVLNERGIVSYTYCLVDVWRDERY